MIEWKTVLSGVFVSAVIFTCILTIITSCSYSVVMSHTTGTATDLVDTQQEAKTSISIPLLKK